MVFETNLDSVPESFDKAPNQAKCPVCNMLADKSGEHRHNRYSYDCGGGGGEDEVRRFYVEYWEENGDVVGSYRDEEIVEF